MVSLEDISTGSIVIEVKDFNKVLSDVSLGVAEISLSEQRDALARGEYFELPLTKKGVPNGGVLIVMAGIRPLQGIKSSVKPSEAHQYQLARIVMAEDIIFPNTLIKGFVVLRLPKPMKFNVCTLSYERSIKFSLKMQTPTTTERRMTQFDWPSGVYRLKQAIELNPLESAAGSEPQPFQLDQGMHVFAFELPAEEREISHFESPGYDNRAMLSLELIDASNKLYTAIKGITFAHDPRFMPTSPETSDVLKSPRLPPTNPEYIPLYASQFVPGYVGDAIPLELLYSGDLKHAFSRDLVSHVKVEWPMAHFAESYKWWSTRFMYQEFSPFWSLTRRQMGRTSSNCRFLFIDTLLRSGRCQKTPFLPSPRSAVMHLSVKDIAYSLNRPLRPSREQNHFRQTSDSRSST